VDPDLIAEKRAVKIRRLLTQVGYSRLGHLRIDGLFGLDRGLTGCHAKPISRAMTTFFASNALRRRRISTARARIRV